MRSYTRQARHHQRVEAAARAAHDARIASLNAVAAAAAAGARTFGGPLQLQPPRPRLADFIPPPQEHTRHVRYREPIEEPRTPPGHPESEDDDWYPNLEECEVVDQVGYDEEEAEPGVTEPGPFRPDCIVKIRNTRTGTSRHSTLKRLFRPDRAGISQLFRPDKINKK